MVGEAEHPNPLADGLRGSHHAARHPLYTHTFSGHDAVGADDQVDTGEHGPLFARLLAGVALWGLILVLML